MRQGSQEVREVRRSKDFKMEQEKGLLHGLLLLLFALAGWGTNPGPHAESSDRLGHQSRVKIPEARSGLIIKGRWTRKKRDKKAKDEAQAGDEGKKSGDQDDDEAWKEKKKKKKGSWESRWWQSPIGDGKKKRMPKREMGKKRQEEAEEDGHEDEGGGKKV